MPRQAEWVAQLMTRKATHLSAWYSCERAANAASPVRTLSVRQHSRTARSLFTPGTAADTVRGPRDELQHPIKPAGKASPGRAHPLATPGMNTGASPGVRTGAGCLALKLAGSPRVPILNYFCVCTPVPKGLSTPSTPFGAASQERQQHYTA